MKGKRLDQRLFELGLAESREKAKATIMSGIVYVNGQKSDKPGTQVSDDAEIVVRGNACPYVSRGGFKLAKALEVFPVEPAGKVCIDCGASTGGFTDVLLKNGAAKVYAVDVGYGQLAWQLRQDSRVVVMERTNARALTPDMFPESMDLGVMDVSFISIRLILPALHGLLKPGGEVVCLIKPQFEAQPRQLGKNGIVKDPAILPPLLLSLAAAARDSRLFLRGLTVSPIHGTNGNVEYLAAFSRRDALDEDETAALVAAALAEQPDE